MIGDIEDIMKKVHNPKLIKNHINVHSEFPKIKQYVLEIIEYYKKKTDVSKKELSKLLFSLDKKYKFSRRPKQSNLIYVLRKCIMIKN